MKVEEMLLSDFVVPSRTCHKFSFSDGTMVIVYDGGECGYETNRRLNVYLEGHTPYLSMNQGINLIVGKGPLFSKRL